MAMTKSRRDVYKRSWYEREIKLDKSKRKREYHKKVRSIPIESDEIINYQRYKNATKLDWNTIS